MEHKITVIYKKPTLWIGENKKGNQFWKTFDENTSDHDKQKFSWKKCKT